MGFWAACYCGAAMIGFAVIVNNVLVLGLHDWGKRLFGWLPVGQLVGWVEIVLFAFLFVFSFFKMLEELKKCSRGG